MHSVEAGDRIPEATVWTVTVAYPLAKSKVAFATGVPLAVLSWVVNRSVPGARLVVVVSEVPDVVVWFADWLLFAHPLSPIAGAASRAPAMIAGLIMGAAYPRLPTPNPNIDLHLYR